MADAEAFGFEVEWYDKQANLVRRYQLTVFRPQRGSLEVAMFDPKTKRSFLKRMPTADLLMEDLYVGGTITLHGRQLKIIDYSDERTRIEFEANRDCLVLVTAPDAFYQLGKIIACLEGLGLTVSRLRLVNENGPVTAMQVMGSDAEMKWETARNTMPAGAAQQVSVEEGHVYFEDKNLYPCTAAYDHCTLCVIRPHAVKAHAVGPIVASIMEAGFEVSAARMVHLDRAQATEFLEVYQNVMPNFSDMVSTMCEAPCLALELRKDGDVVEEFRSLCGPYDMDMAKHLRPGSLRARYGVDNARNGVHCTDLREDAQREVRYIFEVLD